MKATAQATLSRSAFAAGHVEDSSRACCLGAARQRGQRRARAADHGAGRAGVRLGQARDPHGRRQQSFNVFGIKADRSWKGPVAETATTEYVNGAPQKTRAAFRAYGSYDEAFADYAKFISSNPRYSGVVATRDPAEAAHGLQRAGYATDPEYGGKLVRIMQKFG
jgi:flagellar protein FlgJ